MKIQITPQAYRANATQINVIPKISPLVLVFETLDNYYHCMSYFAARRSLSKNPVSLTVFNLKKLEGLVITELKNMEEFLEIWRENYFNPSFDFEEVKERHHEED